MTSISSPVIFPLWAIVCDLFQVLIRFTFTYRETPRANAKLARLWFKMGSLAQTLPLQRSSVQSAHELIKQYIHETPVLTCKTLNAIASTPQIPEHLIGTAFEGRRPARPRISFFFKCENYQRIGAFKLPPSRLGCAAKTTLSRIGAFKSRGAFHALSRLFDEELKRGVVTHSSGTLASSALLSAAF